MWLSGTLWWDKNYLKHTTIPTIVVTGLNCSVKEGVTQLIIYTVPSNVVVVNYVYQRFIIDTHLQMRFSNVYNILCTFNYLHIFSWQKSCSTEKSLWMEIDLDKHSQMESAA